MTQATNTRERSGSPPPGGRPRVVLLVNRRKPQVVEAMGRLHPWLEQRAQIVAEPQIDEDDAAKMPGADLAIVLGGDGTLLYQARRMVDVDLPILGVNFGKVGFLAEFNLEDVIEHWDRIVAGKCRMSQRMLMDVAVYPSGAPQWGAGDEPMPQPLFRSVALNDAVITSGPPFRMVEIELAIEPRVTGSSAATLTGDGIIISTPSGSTAYNLNAGGPIVSPGLDAFCVSALAPQSIAFRPIVLNASCELWLTMQRVNEGTQLVLDGQESCHLDVGQQVMICKHPHNITLVHNPKMNYWNLLSRKMHWAVRPQRD